MAPSWSLAVVRSEDEGLWHARLGHPSYASMVKLSSLVNVEFSKNSSLSCDVCYRAKHTRTPFDDSNNKETRPFALIHCDICGRYKTPSLLGAHYFLKIVDDYSRGVWVYLLKENSETCNLIKRFCAMVENQFGLRVQKVKSDNGMEFVGTSLQAFYREKGIIS